ncbi:MAG: transferase [Pseudomonadota bacterium]
MSIQGRLLLASWIGAAGGRHITDLEQAARHEIDSVGSDAYRAAAVRLGLPTVSQRGALNQNPQDIGFWHLVAEDYRAHDKAFFEQGFWALFVHRFGNWRMGQPKLIRAPATVLYWIFFKLVEWLAGISLWYPVRLGRRVRIWHHSGIVVSARYIGDDVQLRQNTTMGVARTDRLGELPIIEAGADIGAGAVIVGPVLVGQGARIAAGALVFMDVPPGALAIGNPAQIKVRRDVSSEAGE